MDPQTELELPGEGFSEMDTSVVQSSGVCSTRSTGKRSRTSRS